MSRLSSSGIAAARSFEKAKNIRWGLRERGEREREISEAKSVSRRCENGQRQTRKRETTAAREIAIELT